MEIDYYFGFITGVILSLCLILIIKILWNWRKEKW